MSVTFKDYYKTLGVDRKATNEEIKTAFRKGARKNHPDLRIKSEKAAAEERFKEINEAYEVLGNAEKRTQYDQQGESRRTEQQGQTQSNKRAYESQSQSQSWSEADSSQYSDIFENLFGRAGAGGFQRGFEQQRNVRGQNLETTIPLTLEEAFHGGPKTFQFSTKNRCGACGGTGVASQKKCQSCTGTGYKTTVKTIVVKIPAGMTDGLKIRLKGQGGEGTAGGERGDLLLAVEILPHARFTLSGTHLRTTKIIRPEQAVLGGEVPILTLEGEVMVTIPPMSHNGHKVQLRSKGWPGKGGARGDLFVEISIDIPQTLNQAEREIYKRLAEMKAAHVQ